MITIMFSASLSPHLFHLIIRPIWLIWFQWNYVECILMHLKRGKKYYCSLVLFLLIIKCMPTYYMTNIWFIFNTCCEKMVIFTLFFFIYLWTQLLRKILNVCGWWMVLRDWCVTWISLTFSDEFNYWFDNLLSGF